MIPMIPENAKNFVKEALGNTWESTEDHDVF